MRKVKEKLGDAIISIENKIFKDENKGTPRQRLVWRIAGIAWCVVVAWFIGQLTIPLFSK